MPAIDQTMKGAAAGDLAILQRAAVEASGIAMAYFRADPAVWYKNEGNSPVSAADMAIDLYLRETLTAARPSYGWLSEETVDDADRLDREHVFVVDPIDGTRAYLAGLVDWCVSIAISRNGVAVAGVLAAPARGETWFGSLGQGAFLNGEPVAVHASAPGAPLRVSMPDSISGGVMASSRGLIERSKGGPSLALRLARVAGGEIDGVYVRPRASEWDIAAADVLLRETGHRLVDETGNEVTYNHPDPSRGLLVAGAREEVALLRSHLATGSGH
ncbi:myo-inositol-1(or 4)-monophosphatase [Hoeflea marina]|uniref:Myo-inositol-1(Or 4)-monophosphatase n=1 Tax=Hoeflea marina TaxID=274592 RepID=A0A317PRU6_9HYPH|nr:3'(2'),5'-bisphosphate nucleotidase CysQ [Hoeflea marina]PWW01614.1 myo-inositol-1(or 4)-monophosphatase [Hoeflea marina]